MRILDANLLVYAFVRDMPQHRKAVTWLDDVLNGVARVGIPWSTGMAFIRLVSNPRIFERPVSIPVAWKQLEEWIGCGSVWIPEPTERHAEVLGEILDTPGMTSNQVPDAHLAALAIEHGLIVCTSDNDFQRFTGIRIEDPKV